MVVRWLLGAGLLCAGVGVSAAQELRCTQVFMNPSEKRICATPELMELDRQVGEVGRRAAIQQPSFKSDQRRFRKALKTCDGDAECLRSSYEVRISELQAFVATLPGLSDEESAQLLKAEEKAEARRDAQANARERIAQRLEDPAAVEHVMAEPSEAQAPENSTAVSSMVEEVVEEPMLPVDGQVEAAAPDSGVGRSETGWGERALMGGALLGVLVWLKSGLNRIVRRCPRCTTWFAGDIIDSNMERYTDYETKTFEDVHRDRYNVIRGRTTKQRQVKVNVSKTTNQFQCSCCGNRWAWSSTSRSS